MPTLSSFIEKLASYKGSDVYNPWADYQPEYDIPHSPPLRRKHLHDYLERRLKQARILLIAEACGYQGGHFTGIAMTCERMLLNAHPLVNSQMVLGREGVRTSRTDSPHITKKTQIEKGFNEPTDTVVWRTCLEAGLKPEEFLLWNIFPFHPHKKNNLLTNRTPTEEELSEGLLYTQYLLALTGPLPLFAIGKKSEHILRDAGFSVVGLRHPANGGARIFHEGLIQALPQYL